MPTSATVCVAASPHCEGSTSPPAPSFSTVSEADLDAVADQLNDRPRKRLAYAKPSEAISELLLH